MARLWRARQSPVASGTLGRCGSAPSLWSSPAQLVLLGFTSCTDLSLLRRKMNSAELRLHTEQGEANESSNGLVHNNVITA